MKLRQVVSIGMISTILFVHQPVLAESSHTTVVSVAMTNVVSQFSANSIEQWKSKLSPANQKFVNKLLNNSKLKTFPKIEINVKNTFEFSMNNKTHTFRVVDMESGRFQVNEVQITLNEKMNFEELYYSILKGLGAKQVSWVDYLPWNLWVSNAHAIVLVDDVAMITMGAGVVMLAVFHGLYHEYQKGKIVAEKQFEDTHAECVAQRARASQGFGSKEAFEKESATFAIFSKQVESVIEQYECNSESQSAFCEKRRLLALCYQLFQTDVEAARILSKNREQQAKDEVKVLPEGKVSKSERVIPASNFTSR